MSLFTLNKINIINIFIVDGKGHIFLYKHFGVSNKTLHWVSQRSITRSADTILKLTSVVT